MLAVGVPCGGAAGGRQVLGNLGDGRTLRRQLRFRQRGVGGVGVKCPAQVQLPLLRESPEAAGPGGRAIST